MKNNLDFNIGGKSFNTKLLFSGWDDTDLAFGNIWMTETEIVANIPCTLNIEVTNASNTSKDVYLKIYSDDVEYYGTTSEQTITSGGLSTYTFTDTFESSGNITIRIEAWVEDVNYISTTYIIYVTGSNLRILTTGEDRLLTTSETRVVV